MSNARYLDCSPYMRDLIDADLRALVPELELHLGDPAAAELPGLLAGMAAVLNGHTAMPRAVLEAAPELRSIVFLGTGASSYIDTGAAAERGIAVRVIKGYGDRTVAEHAFALLLAAAREIPAMDRAMRAGGWQQTGGVELAGKTLGVLGTGGIGGELIRIAAGFGMKVIAWNRSGVPKDLPCTPVSVDALFVTADVIAPQLALTEETRGMIGADLLARVKPGAMLVNTARGALVDTGALIAALRDGPLGHAALDVYDTEPLPAGHPLRGLANVTLTCHAAFKTPEASYRLLKMGCDLLRADLDAIEAGRALSG